MTGRLLTQEILAGVAPPMPPFDQDKEARGAVLVVAGGAAVPGAPILTGRAALGAGCGKLQLAASRQASCQLGMSVPEAAIIRVPAAVDGELSKAARRALAGPAEAADAVVIGPGMVEKRHAQILALNILCDTRAPVVIDAGALPDLQYAETVSRNAQGRVVLTPHAGEMAALTERSKDEVMADPGSVALEISAKMNAIVVLKGATTYIATPQGKAWRHEGGVVGLATSGSGDVLAGLIGGLLARGSAPAHAALWGVYVHAEIGRQLSAALGPVGFLASDLLPRISRVLGELASSSSAPRAS